MSIGLLLPLGLAALAAIVVPLLIHLVRRPEQAPYDFPAMRWLSKSERPRRRLRLDDIALLLLRLILLALVALLLAVPVLQGEWRDARHWILASSNIDLSAALNTASDEQTQWRWLAPGFPDIERERPARQQPTASLVREFEATLPPSDTLTVLVTAELDGLDAERIALSREVEWVAIPDLDLADSGTAQFKPQKISLRYASEDQESLRYVRAALDALEAGEPERWQIDDEPDAMPVDATSKAVIWLGATLPDTLQSWIEAGGRALVVDLQAESGSIVLRDKNGDAIAIEQAVGAGELVQFLRPLTPAALPMLLDAEFPERLRVLLEGAAPAPTRGLAAEVAPRLVDRAAHSLTTALSGLLCLFIAIVFLLERIVATRRRRAP